MSALENLVRAAMASGFACISERMATGEADLAAPLTDVLGDFPSQFLAIRPTLVEDLRAEWGLPDA